MIERMNAIPDGNLEIWLAGGCFWGTQAHLDNINGVRHACRKSKKAVNR